MQGETAVSEFRKTSGLLRGDPELTASWTQEWNWTRVGLYVGLILVGAGIYGAAMGCWRGPLQGFYSGVKLPLVILITTLGNALLNGMLAPLLGLNLGLRQAFLAVLMSFVIASVVIGSFAPLLLFMVWNLPPMPPDMRVTSPLYSSVLLTAVCGIAFAGIIANVRLFELLKRLSGSRKVALRLLFAWLAVNLLLGGQISWNLRPFVTLPDSPVTFFWPHPFDGNFFEAIFRAVRTFFL